jgi:hypothetical protein
VNIVRVSKGRDFSRKAYFAFKSREGPCSSGVVKNVAEESQMQMTSFIPEGINSSATAEDPLSCDPSPFAKGRHLRLDAFPSGAVTASRSASSFVRKPCCSILARRQLQEHVSLCETQARR